jgi:acetyl esterase/lipase
VSSIYFVLFDNKKNLLSRFKITTLLFFLSLAHNTEAQEYILETNISYYGENVADPYQKERCKLDLYYPKEVENFPTVVWFHGGGLKSGNKSVPELLKEKGIAVATVNYRLHPKVKAPVYIEDAAAAVAWTFKNIEKYGGNSTKIVLSGSSAGGYLSLMIGLDKNYLKPHQIDANDILALLPLTGHAITHFTVRAEQNISKTQPIIDRFAPLFHVRADAPPIVLYTGDPELELLGRAEENAYMMRMLKEAGHQNVKHIVFEGYGHGIQHPALPLVIKEIKQLIRNENNAY